MKELTTRIVIGDGVEMNRYPDRRTVYIGKRPNGLVYRYVKTMGNKKPLNAANEYEEHYRTVRSPV